MVCGAGCGAGDSLRLMLRRLPVLLVCALTLSGPDASAYLSGLSNNFLLLSSVRFGRDGMLRIERRGSEERHLQEISAATLRLLERVNLALNQYAYSDDQQHWGTREYWATPAEFVGSGSGDCEDYAIAKYYALRAAGVEVQHLRFVYVRALVDGRLINHMVLAYYAQPEADPLVLDNLRDEILPASRRPDLLPVFTFNDEDQTRNSGDGSLARRWRDLAVRINTERNL